MSALGSHLFLEVFSSVLGFSMILVTLCFLYIPKDVSGLCLKVGGKHIVEGEGESELKGGQREECKKFLQESVFQ